MFKHAIARRTLTAIAIGLAAAGAHAQLLGGLGAGGGGALGGNLGGSLTGGASIPVITQPRTIDATRSAAGSVGQAARQDAASLGRASPHLALSGNASGNASANAGGSASGNAGAGNSAAGVGGLNAGIRAGVAAGIAAQREMGRRPA
jgi:hypothetical protein